MKEEKKPRRGGKGKKEDEDANRHEQERGRGEPEHEATENSSLKRNNEEEDGDRIIAMQNTENVEQDQGMPARRQSPHPTLSRRGHRLRLAHRHSRRCTRMVRFMWVSGISKLKCSRVHRRPQEGATGPMVDSMVFWCQLTLVVYGWAGGNSVRRELTRWRK